MENRGRKKRYLLNTSISEHNLREYLNTNCVGSERRKRLSELSEKFENLKKISLTDANQIDPTPKMKKFTSTQLEWATLVLDNASIRNSFPNGGIPALIDVDNVISPQLVIDIDHTQLIAKKPFLKSGRISKKLIEYALEANSPDHRFSHLEQPGTSGAIQIFSSQTPDLRYLGSFYKELQKSDLDYLRNGGNPIAAIISFVGYGTSTINAYRYRNKIILSNGFHRVVALKSIGFQHIPMFLQDIQDPSFQMPAAIWGFPRDPLLNMMNPPRIKHYFDENYFLDFTSIEQTKVVTLQTVFNENVIPNV